MNTKIFYFTGTGNSLVVAKNLAQNLSNTELVPIPKVIDGNIDLNADKIGLVFPVYAWGPPRMVANFINKLNSDNKNKYFFAVVTYGGMPGGALIKTSKLLANRGIKLSLGMGLRLPGNYVALYGAWPEESQKKSFEKLKGRINEIAVKIRNNSTGIIEKNSFFINFLGNIMYKMMMGHVATKDKNFWINNKCNNCGICNRICPTNNIKIENGIRSWTNNCEQCMACIQWCPKEAIQFKNKTENRKRYHHPDVKAQELFYR